MRLHVAGLNALAGLAYTMAGVRNQVKMVRAPVYFVIVS